MFRLRLRGPVKLAVVSPHPRLWLPAWWLPPPLFVEQSAVTSRTAPRGAKRVKPKPPALHLRVRGPMGSVAALPLPRL